MDMNKTKERSELIIEKSKALFYKFGVKKVSVEEICAECKMGKKTFYAIFPNKFEVVKIILMELEDMHLEYYEQVKKEKISFKDKMIKMINKKVESIDTVEFAFFRDVYEHCEELRSFTDNLIKESERETFRFVSDEQKSGGLREDFPARFISYLLSDYARRLIMDPEVEKMIPDTNERIKSVIDAVVNGVTKSD